VHGEGDHIAYYRGSARQRGGDSSAKAKRAATRPLPTATSARADAQDHCHDRPAQDTTLLCHEAFGSDVLCSAKCRSLVQDTQASIIMHHGSRKRTERPQRNPHKMCLASINAVEASPRSCVRVVAAQKHEDLS
jgi:hypothetical protein